MSKINKLFQLEIKIFILILVFISNLYFGSEHANAETPLNQCPGSVQTNPAPLTNTSSNAVFNVPLGNLYDSSVTKWSVEFECGLKHQVVDAQWDPQLMSLVSNSIARQTLPGAGYSCEFFEGNHTIIIKGGDTPRCRAYYNVINSDSQCELTITPATGITSNTEVKVSGKNLTDQGQFSLFIDNYNPYNYTENNLSGTYVKTPEFSPISIPKNKLSPTRHKVFLKRKNAVYINPYDAYGPSLCPKEFTVGTPDAPGGVIDSNVIICQKSGDPSCTSGGGKLINGCSDPSKPGYDPKNPAIATAIGCIHTNPTELIKDSLKFVVGIGGGLAFLMMLLGAFQMITSAGNPETLNAGKERLTSAVIGLLMVIFAILLLQIIGVGILNLPGFK